MTLSEAQAFLGISASASREDLEGAFRRLIKTYHPDKNQNRTAWSHTMTIRLNEAYDIILKELVENTPTLKPTIPEYKNSSSSSSSDPHILENFRRSFRIAQDEAMQGIYIYYNFGLDNIHRRQEGVFRQRFNSALNHLKKSIDSLAVLGLKAPTEGQRRHLVLYSTFFRLFRENMLIKKLFVPDGSLNHKAYRHYRMGSENLDDVLKSRLFPKDFNKNGISSKNFSLSEYEFMQVITQFKSSIWVPETVIKLMLIDGFRRIEEFETGMTHMSHAR
jgi:curved DNA-binding protein CbpA